MGVGLTRMAATPRRQGDLAGGGHFAVAPSVAEAMEAGCLPALDEDQADMFTPSELLLYQHVRDHRLQTRDILGYPS